MPLSEKFWGSEKEMIDLTNKEFSRLQQLVEKAKRRMANSNELRELIELIQKSGARTREEIEQYINQAGFASLEELNKHIEEKKSQEFIDILIAVGLGILAAYVVTKVLGK